MSATPEGRGPSLQAAGVTLSPIGFGCASLMRLPSARDRRELIHAAIDAGITHFDIARMYGLGAAEAELGRALRERSETVTVATKFGIDASGALGRLGRLQAPARALLARSSALRARIRARRDSFASPRRYDPEKARLSLDQSLRELGLDHVDLLFLHDPRPQDHVDAQPLVAFLEDARSAGKIRAWGVSLDATPDPEALAKLPSGVLQMRHDPLEATPPPNPAIVFGALGLHGAIHGYLTGNPAVHRQWVESLGGDPLAGDLLATLLLSNSLALPGAPATLYATTRAARLTIPAALLTAPPPPAQVATFSGLLTEHAAALRGLRV